MLCKTLHLHSRARASIFESPLRVVFFKHSALFIRLDRKKIIFSDYQNIRCFSFSSPSLNMMIQKISLGIFKIISLEIFNSFTSFTVDIAKSRIKNQDLEGVKSGHRIVRLRFAPSSNGAMPILKSIAIPYYKIQLPRIESLLSPLRLEKRSRKSKSFFLG